MIVFFQDEFFFLRIYTLKWLKGDKIGGGNERRAT
jgi:hypothetical protein